MPVYSGALRFADHPSRTSSFTSYDAVSGPEGCSNEKRATCGLRNSECAAEVPRSLTQIALLNDPKLANPALQPNHGGVGSVVRAQFGEDISDSTFGCQSKAASSRKFVVAWHSRGQIASNAFVFVVLSLQASSGCYRNSARCLVFE